MRALVAEKKGGPAILIDRAPPRLRPNGYMLVRPIAVALNPADVALLDFAMAEGGNLLGCDYAGVVVEVGAGVHRNFKKGDRVCGPMRAGDPNEAENGTFAELICVKADVALHIPESMSFEDASTLGVTSVTTGRCLYQKFNLPFPDQALAGSGQVFIYGGSSAMGTMLIQFAKLSGYEVVTTCSPHNFELCRSYGAEHVFDYNEAQAPERIRRIINGPLKICVDCISTNEAAAFCAKVLSPGAKYSGILLAECPRNDVQSVKTLGYSFLGEEWEQFGKLNPASPEDFEYSKNFAEHCERLLEAGKIKAHPVAIREGGLPAIIPALDELRQHKISGAKLVVRI